MDRIRAAGAEILACSTDSVFTERVFAASLGGLPFPVASDFGRTVTAAYGVLRPEGYAIRSVFVIDEAGTVVYENPAFQANNPAHYEEALAALSAPRVG